MRASKKLAFLFLASATLSWETSLQKERRPNILFILADDLGTSEYNLVIIFSTLLATIKAMTMCHGTTLTSSRRPCGAWPGRGSSWGRSMLSPSAVRPGRHS